VFAFGQHLHGDQWSRESDGDRSRFQQNQHVSDSGHDARDFGWPI
jgi:hypothetical protein